MRSGKAIFVTSLYFLFYAMTVAIPKSLLAKEGGLTIIHTNDLHSYLFGFSLVDNLPLISDSEEGLGGWARIASVINKERNNRDNSVLVLDAGDFLVGAFPYDIGIDKNSIPNLMKEMGYDAITLGNHDFDLGPGGLAEILLSSYKRGSIPEIIFSSAIFSKERGEDDSLEALFNKKIISPYIILEKYGFRIGIFGVMGRNAAMMSPFAYPVKFKDPIQVSIEMIKLLKIEKRMDMVICLSHSGLAKDALKSEDEILATKVEGIDIIISGHTHTKLITPIIISDTIIVQAGEYGMHVGVLDVYYKDGMSQFRRYNLIEINDRIKKDERIQKKIESIVKNKS
ncbi:MAG: metallophosphatase [Spirochaetota bacterium]|nr:metallophosphatase [Spirochaetota bacterium]